LIFDTGRRGAPAGAFLTPFQDAPLDLDVGCFSGARASALRARVAEVGAMAPSTLVGALGAAWRAHKGQVARGMRWAAAPLPLLQLIALGLSPPTLAALCDALCANYRLLSGGLPDLLLWRVDFAEGGAEEGGGLGVPFFAPPPAAPAPGAPAGACADVDLALPPTAAVRVRFVEVKGPSDKLRDGQHAWLRILGECGADTGVCKVVDSAVEGADAAALAKGVPLITPPPP
jgi:Fanconi-associated nuclease 1